MLSIISVVVGLSLAMSAPPEGYEQGVVLWVYAPDRVEDHLTDPDPPKDLRAIFHAPKVDFRDQDQFGGFEDHFRAVVTGSIMIETPGRYEFALVSDDGSDFWIGNDRVIANDGLHSVQQANGSVELEPGLHPFRVRYFENGGDEVLTLKWRPPGQLDMSVVPSSVLVAKADDTGTKARGIRTLGSPGVAEAAHPGLGSTPMFVPPEIRATARRPVQLETVDGITQGATFSYARGGETADLPSDVAVYAGMDDASPQSAGSGSQIQSMRAVPGGFEIGFSAPVSKADAENPASFQIAQWCYVPTPDSAAERRELETLTVQHSNVSADGSKVILAISGLAPGRVVHVQARVRSAGAQQVSASDAWYTLNTMPSSPEHPAPDLRVLVFSKTAGFRHSSIPDGIKSIREMGRRFGFDVHATEDGAYFNDEALSAYNAVVFLSTTGDVLDGEQQGAFERYIRAGGGYVGVHAASDTEYEWPWYGHLVGAYFLGHPAIQDATIRVLDREHISTNMLPGEWPRRDEWYNFRSKPGHVHVLANLDETTYQGGTMNNDHPIAWCHEFEGGRAFYTAGGHTEESFAEDLFLRHLAGGIYWAAGHTHMPE